VNRLLARFGQLPEPVQRSIGFLAGACFMLAVDALGSYLDRPRSVGKAALPPEPRTADS
jgi:hypothetical protein